MFDLATRKMVERLGLKAFIRVGMLGSILIFSVAFFSIYIYSIGRTLDSRKEDVKNNFTALLSEALAEAIIVNDEKAIQRILDSAVKEGNVVDISLKISQGGFNLNTTEFRASSAHRHSRYSIKVVHDLLWYLSSHEAIVWLKGVSPTVTQEIVTNTSFGSKGEILGTLSIRMDFFDTFSEKISIFLFFVALMVVMVSFSLSMGRRIESGVVIPIRNLLKALTHMHENKFEEVLSVTASDQREINDLICLFNTHSNMIMQSNRELRRMLECQDEVIAQRTRDLKEALRRSEEAAKIKSDFINLMSHELKQPIYSASMALANMMRTAEFKDAPRLGEYTKRINEGLRRAEDQIGDVLEYSRNLRSGVVVKMSNFDLYRNMENLYGFMSLACYGKGLFFDLIIDPHVPNMIQSSWRNINYVVRNFIDNAIKFTDHGGVVVRLSTAEVSSPDQLTLLISVKDTGIGIPPGELDAIFEPFHQVEGMSGVRKVGHGLGLSIAISNLQAIGGRHEVQSSPSGTTMTALIPVQRGIPPLGHEQRVCASLLSSMNVIFVVYDNRQTFLEGLFSRLQNIGAQCETASSFDELVQVMQSIPQGIDTVMIVRRAYYSAMKDFTGGVARLRSLNPRLIISYEPSVEAQTFINHDDGEGVDLMLNGSESTSNLLTQVRDMLSPKGEALHEIFYDQAFLFEQNTLRDVSILMIDDDLTNLDYTAEFLSSYGATVHIAHGHKFGLALAAEHVYDVILIDIMMPEVGGIDVAHEIRGSGKNTDTPLMAFTAATLTEKDLAAIECLNMTLLNKPDARDQIVMMIRSAIITRQDKPTALRPVQ